MPSALQAFRWTVFTLLGVNVLLFFSAETFIEGLDSLAWLALLLLFELEARLVERQPGNPGSHPLLRWARGIAYLAIGWCVIGYSLPAHVSAHGWLDALNAWTWVAIVFLLELDLRQVPAGERGRRLRTVAKTPLYAALLGYALLWGLGGSWLDFYDALLWILCFFTIELQLFGSGGPRPAGSAAPSPARRA